MKKNRDRIMDTENILMVAWWEGLWGNRWRGEGIKKHKYLTFNRNLINKTNKQAKYNQIHWNWEQANSDRKETRTHINDLEQKKERNIHPEKKEETRIQKREET